MKIPTALLFNSTNSPHNSSAPLLGGDLNPSERDILPISREFPEYPAVSHPQDTDTELPTRKRHPSGLLEKISPEQRQLLFQWLADHTYEEVAELIAAEPPDGFGFTVGKSTLGRFYKAHFFEIDSIRQDRIQERAVEMLGRQHDHDYRAMLRDSYSQLLLERLWELLSRPVQSADELKKLTVIAEKMKSLDRDKELLDEVLQKHRQAEMNNLISAALTKSTAPTDNP